MEGVEKKLIEPAIKKLGETISGRESELGDAATKEELEGKRCIVFTNLEPRTIRGVESQGMILAVSNGDKSKVKLLNANGEIELGSKVS